MNKLSFRQKLWLPLVFSLIALTLISVFNAWQARAIRMEERKNNLVSVTTQAVNLVKQYDDLARAGTLTKDEAQKQALTLLTKVDFEHKAGELIFGDRFLLQKDVMGPAAEGILEEWGKSDWPAAH